MTHQLDFADLEPDDRGTALALFAAFKGVGLHRPSPVGSAEADELTAVLLEKAFDAVRLERPTPGADHDPGSARANGAPGLVVLPARKDAGRPGRAWAAAAAAAVLVLALVLTLAPGGSSVVWAAEPSTPTAADREAVATACSAPLARGLGDLESSGTARTDGVPAPDPGPGPTVPESLPPLAVLDIRGDGALAIYQDPTWQVTCLLARERGAWVDQGISVGPGPSTMTPGVVFGSRTTWIDGDSVAFLGGSVAPGTSKVTFDLSDGTTVRASLLGTTFAAWFPGERAYVPGSLVVYDSNNTPHR